MSRGYTLVEIIIVLAVFSILMLAGTEMFLRAVTESNRANIQNEVRQNAGRVIQSLISSIRTAACVSWTISGLDLTLTTFSDTGCAVLVDTYQIKTSESGTVYKNNNKITSGAVGACADAGCAANCTLNGLTITGTSGTNQTVGLSLTIQQKPQLNIRSDFCARIILTETVTPRQY